MTELKFYNKYFPKPLDKGTSFKGHEEVCNQQAKEECEISKILHQYEAGEISELPVVREANYNDVLITPQSFNDAKAMIDKVTNDFYSLPVETQRAFGDIQTYVQDISKIAQGDSEALAKYKNFQVTSPKNDFSDVTDLTASGTSSSSISRSDSEIGLTDIKTSDTKGFAGKE